MDLTYLSYEDAKKAILDDFSTPYWIKDAIKKLDNADPVDAANEAYVLHRLMDKRLKGSIL